MTDQPQATANTALLIIDMINDMDFEEGGKLLDEIDVMVDVVPATRASIVNGRSGS